MKEAIEEKKWVLCPICGAKTRLQLLPETELKAFPLFCPKCRRESVRKKTTVPVNIPLFTLQGNFNVKKLHGIYRPMMEIMVKTAGKSLAAKKDRTPEEDDMLSMMLHG